MIMENKNRKVLIISIVAVVLLVVAIVATSYAMFTANLSGTKQNRINTGHVSLNCTETTFELTDTTALSDAEGIDLADNAATCTLVSTMNGSMKIGYDIALAEIDSVSPTDSIGENNVKIQANKVANGGTTSYLAGTSATEGVLISDLANSPGAYDETITGYNIDSAIVEGNNTIVYTVKAWVASLGEGGVNTESSAVGVCSDETYTTESTCEAAGEIWGDSQTSSQEGGTFSFKLKVGATQTFDENTSTSNAVYSWTTDTVSLGASKDSISGYTTDYTTLGKNYFLKHNIGSNNTVESNEVCYILNDTQYCLKGCSNYNSDEDICEVTNFEENSATLLESFGEDNCSVNSDYVECSASGLFASAYSYGYVDAYAGITACGVFDDGTAGCNES